MVTAGHAAGGAGPAARRRLPPVAEASVAALVLVLASGIYLASYLPAQAPLGPAVALVAVAGALVLADVAMLARLREFAWDRFFLVARWTLLAYAVQAGMLEWVIVHNDARGAPLVLLTLSLAIFAIVPPLLFAFSVARYQPVARPADDR